MPPALDDLLPAYLRCPPLMRDAYAQRYIGERVCWRLALANTAPQGAGQFVLVNATHRRLWHRFSSSAFFVLDPGQFPELHSATRGRRLQVRGVIEAIKPTGIRLNLETLTVLPKSIFDQMRY